ncbi:MAG: hypothetical protein A2186_04235 [Candidatus Levybacteria bacterium RIFOXYA1_FULL_41_10]|nr:MAG: hypothetical protein UT87_C0007G0002 [Candidatus Levybacteria bacterium GW2011_GWC1_40_19]KKR73074.1 MAG: hypothetical protein UU15_C0020G0009 [Candidatus Levybacteria bacterium GW2011_GWC2_40_7]KKR94669.1 MAG: hypothetical protein UU45_C0008G0069 [Candidatus Levybacteria bacterium GW2011_GWA2_41_15]KKS00407.1 MAG: hypothetical protein UU52_C0034G0012 [Candidatus Levybacteria bacterium GW2011_GWB1_41_21]OGH26959.1 MAG: hypothetical protein A3D82_02570 [Candidatus Levybacteria bacterium 
MNLRKLIKEYLQEAKLMQLATSVNDQPWVCSVWFAADDEMNIYWFSSITRKHSEDIIKNPNVAAAIIIPQTPKDTPRGLQLKGTAQVLTDQKNIDHATSVYKDRIFPIETIEKLMKDPETPHKFYKIIPSQFVLFDGVNFPNKWRQELNL